MAKINEHTPETPREEAERRILDESNQRKFNSAAEIVSRLDADLTREEKIAIELATIAGIFGGDFNAVFNATLNGFKKRDGNNGTNK
jgi:hypothetical protein